VGTFYLAGTLQSPPPWTSQSWGAGKEGTLGSGPHSLSRAWGSEEVAGEMAQLSRLGENPAWGPRGTRGRPSLSDNSTAALTHLTRAGPGRIYGGALNLSCV
jgi:hypothetical protein